ncbi:hypothetical protein ACCT30_37685 [Rhizobium ruizarguesonis]
MAADVDKAALAARRAFETFSKTSLEERAALIDRIIAALSTSAAMPPVVTAANDVSVYGSVNSFWPALAGSCQRPSM